MSVHSLHKLAKNISHNRWTNEFKQGEKIGKGGFASVYKAKNHFDENDYAIKKIKLRVNNLKGNVKDELERVLTESKFLARVNHHNILRYYNSWLEIGTKRKELTKPKTYRGKNKGEWREVCSDEESEEISTYDSFGELDSPAVVFDRSSEDETDNHHFIFEEKVECSQSTTEQFSKGPSITYEDVEVLDDKREPAKSVDPVLEALSAGLSEEETIEKIILFIQTELCSETLGDYIASRNQKLASIETTNPDGYQKAWKEYSKEAIAFAKQILEGLAHIHTEGIIHRDLKPQNIFLSNKVCKIGDFGLIKMNDSLENMKAQREDCGSPQAGPKANAPSNQQDTNVGAIGTQIFASPEQWEGNIEKFDFKSDIFSLGIVLLLLFHPVSTSMEELQVIKDSKNGKLPAKLEKNLPEIARIIKKMLAVDPCERPSLETVSSSLKIPVEMNIEFSGVVILKREDSEAWNNKHFKLIGKNFYVFNNEHDKKAENVYLLSEWAVLLENNSNITLENPMKLGCSFKMESCEQTNELFNHLRKYVS